jgi:hypothetical protein
VAKAALACSPCGVKANNFETFERLIVKIPYIEK